MSVPARRQSHRNVRERSGRTSCGRVAFATGAPVVPIGIQGSRDVVRLGQKFPRRGAVHVAMGDPIKPGGTGWQAALALRDQARAAVVALCGEPAVG
jgi:1-acyl-sn-glycerol-3-phosphate acyltransferase